MLQAVPSMLCFGLMPDVKSLLCALDVSHYISFIHLATLLGVDFNQLATKCGRHSNNLAPSGNNVAEHFAFLVFLTNVRLNGRCAFAVAIKFPEQLSLNGSNKRIGLGVLKGGEFLKSDGRRKAALLMPGAGRRRFLQPLGPQGWASSCDALWWDMPMTVPTSRSASPASRNARAAIRDSAAARSLARASFSRSSFARAACS